MSAILKIREDYFLLPSAAIAAAIREVLAGAVRLDLVSIDRRLQTETWRTSTTEAPVVTTHLAPDVGAIGGITIAVSPIAQAVLCEPPKSRRSTHRILAEASMQLRERRTR